MSGAEPAEAGTAPPGPAMSVLVPVYRTRPDHLRQMIGSVRDQTMASWELILVDDGSADAELTAVLDQASRSDPRIRVDERPENLGIARASARALELARGEFVALLDHDDTLDVGALAAIVRWIGTHPEADILYTDEDQIDEQGRLGAPFRKPEFSLERLRGQMYIGHLTVYRRELLERVGGFRSGYDGSQDYDLMLRAVEAARLVLHVPEVLYHWRVHRESVSHRADNAAVFDAARRALQEHLQRSGIPGWVEQVHPVGVYRVHRREVRRPLVSIVIPTRGSSAFVRGAERVLITTALRSVLDRTTYPHYEFVVVADAATPAAVIADIRALAGEKLTVVPYDEPFNYSAKVNLGVLRAAGELILLLNDDIEVITPDWLSGMVALLAPDVGMVGAKLLFEDGTIQHVGHVYTGGDALHVAAGAAADWPGPVADLLVDREVSGVTAACALLPKAIYQEVGGLSLALPVNFNDVDLSLKIGEAGYRILLHPHAVLTHYESKTRDRVCAAAEVIAFRRRWDHRLLTDPFWAHDMAAVAAGVAASIGG